MTPYGVFQSLAAVVAVSFAALRLRRVGWAWAPILRLAAVTAAGGLAGGLASGAVTAWLLRGGGVHAGFGGSIFGVAIGSGAAALAWLLRHGLPVGEAFDCGVVPLPLAQAIARLGCFSAGCCYGRPTACWLGMTLADSAGRVARRYPAQLMEAAADLAIFLALVLFERNRRRSRPGLLAVPGSLTLLWVVLYTGVRFTLEFIRGDGVPLAGGVTLGQAVSLTAGGAAAVGLVLIARRLRRLRAPAGSGTAGLGRAREGAADHQDTGGDPERDDRGGVENRRKGP